MTQTIAEFQKLVDSKNPLSSTGLRIFADRYAMKGDKPQAGLFAVAKIAKGTRDVAYIKAVDEEKETALVAFRNGDETEFPFSSLDVMAENTPSELQLRVATGAGEGLPEEKRKLWVPKFMKVLSQWGYIPGGRINAAMGAKDRKGRKAKLTGYNCFVIENIGPHPKHYARSFKRTLEIQARSGGVGMNASSILPRGTICAPKELDKTDTQIAMRVWHPDLPAFLSEAYPHAAKTVIIDEAFKKALGEGGVAVFEFPDTEYSEGIDEEGNKTGLTYDDIWDGDLAAWKTQGLPTIVYGEISAVELWGKIAASGALVAEQMIGAQNVPLKDSRGDIADALEYQWDILLAGKKAGIDLSVLRPGGARVNGVNGTSSGAFSWGHLYAKANWAHAYGFGVVAVGEIMSTGGALTEQGGSRRGALMYMLNDWHADVLEFISCKQDMGLINCANISVGVSDAFMRAKKDGAPYAIGYVKNGSFEGKYEAAYYIDREDFVQTGEIDAMKMWDTVMASAWKSAEPGVVFLERYNEESNSWYYNPIISTNPCGKKTLLAACKKSRKNGEAFRENLGCVIPW